MSLTDEEKRKKASEASKTFYAARRAAHVCIQCGEQDERTLQGKARCQHCVDGQNANSKLRTERLKRKGICGRCHKRPADPGHCLCSLCRSKKSPKSTTYARRKAAHICVQCKRQDKRTLSGLVYCFNCAVARSEKDRERRAKKKESQTNKQQGGTP